MSPSKGAWLILIFFSLTIGTQADTPPNRPATESHTIVQENNKVELVEGANLDESLDRRPDLNFSNVSLDQENSGVSLSSIPAQAVESAEVLKSATPDLDADTRGSILRVQYKPSYTLQDRLLNASLNTRYKALYQSFGYQGNVSWADRLSEDAGFRATAGFEDIQRGSDEMNFDWGSKRATSTGEHYLKRISMGNQRREQTSGSFNGSADHRFSEGNDIYLRLSYESTHVDAVTSNLQLKFGDEAAFNQLSRDAGHTNQGVISRQGSNWSFEDEEISLSLGGRNQPGHMDLEWRVQHNAQSEVKPYDEDVRFERENASIGYTDAMTGFPQFQLTADDTPEEYALTGYDNSSFDRQFGNIVGAVDFKWDREFLKQGDYLKVGIKHSAHTIDIDRHLDTYAITAPDPISLDPFISPHSRADFLGRGYAPGMAPDARATGTFLTNAPLLLERDNLLSSLRSDPGTYAVDEDISAAYAMLNWQGNRLRVVAGARFEDTQLASTGNEVIVTGNDFVVSPRSASNDYSHFFPGLHLQYRLNPTLNLFGSFTKTIKRPESFSIAPFRIIDIEDNEVQEGNPDLRATLYENFDLALDFKPSDALLLSWELFYRDVTDSVYTKTTYLPSGPFAGFELEQLRNGDAATQRGSKILVQQDLGSFAALLKPWSLSLAYTFTESEAAYSQRPGEMFSLIQSPSDRLDTSVTFRGKNAYLQLGFDYRSDTLHRISESGPDKDQFTPSFLSVNLKAEHKLGPHFTAFLDWKNLLQNFERVSTEGTTVARALRYQHDPWAILAGMRYRL